MKIFGLLLMLGLVSVMTAMLTAMSADASARLSLADKSQVAAPALNTASTSSDGSAVSRLAKLASTTAAAEPPRKKTKKRSLATCARVTSTCWGNA